jgi:hypothetical protein
MPHKAERERLRPSTIEQCARAVFDGCVLLGCLQLTSNSSLRHRDLTIFLVKLHRHLSPAHEKQAGTACAVLSESRQTQNTTNGVT